MSVFSVTCGTRACNANCPFCISKQTEACDDTVDFNWRRFDKAMRYVSNQGVQTALITGRGEPTLHTKHLFEITKRLNKYFPNVELQTNGIRYDDIVNRDNPHKHSLVLNGLNTVCISACSLDPEINRAYMGIKDEDFNIRDLVSKVIDDGFTVRLSLQMTNAFFLFPGKKTTDEIFKDIIADAASLGVHQLTFRMIGQPDNQTESGKKASDWIKKHCPSQFAVESSLRRTLVATGTKIATYHWGGVIYDVDGVSVCLADCLTESPEKFEPRTWIFDGKHLRYSWQYKGAIIF